MANPTQLTEPASFDIQIDADGEQWSGRLAVRPPLLVGWVSRGPGQGQLRAAGRFHLERGWAGPAMRGLGMTSIQAWLNFEGARVIMIFGSHEQRFRIAREHRESSARVDAPGLYDHMGEVLGEAEQEHSRWDEQCKLWRKAGSEAEAHGARALWERACLRLILGRDKHDEAALCDARDGAALLQASMYSPDAATAEAGERLAGHLADLRYAEEAIVVRAALNK